MRSPASRNDDLLRLIEQAYAQAETPQRWEELLRSLSRSCNDDPRLIAAVVPHLRQALRIRHRIDEAHDELAAAIEAFDAVPCAVFLVDADANVVRANGRGRAMLAANDGVSLDRSRLSAAGPRETARLRELCAAGGTMALSRRVSERPPLQVTVAPARKVQRPGTALQRVTAVVFVSDTSDERGPSERLLREAYGLTPAESQVAVRIAVGRTLAEIAAERGSALETVRRQNKRILAKTGARHRGDLIRLLSASRPASRAVTRARNT